MKNLKLNVIERSNCRGDVEIDKFDIEIDIEKIDEVISSCKNDFEKDMNRNRIFEVIENKNILNEDELEIVYEILVGSVWSEGLKEDNLIFENEILVGINWNIFENDFYFEGEESEKFYSKLELIEKKNNFENFEIKFEINLKELIEKEIEFENILFDNLEKSIEELKKEFGEKLEKLSERVKIDFENNFGEILNF